MPLLNHIIQINKASVDFLVFSPQTISYIYVIYIIIYIYDNSFCLFPIFVPVIQFCFLFALDRMSSKILNSNGNIMYSVLF